VIGGQRAEDRGQQGLAAGQLTVVIRYTLVAIGYALYAIRDWLYVICHSLNGIKWNLCKSVSQRSGKSLPPLIGQTEYVPIR